MKTPIKKKAGYNNNQSSNKSKKFWKNLDNEARYKLCEVAKKRIRTIRENINDEVKEQICESDQIRKQKNFKNLGDETRKELT